MNSILYEESTEDYLVRRVEALGGLCLKLVLKDEVGWLDRTVFLRGRAAVFEIKREKGGRLSKQQKRQLERVAATGVPNYVCYSKDDIDFALGLFLSICDEVCILW